MTDLPLSKLTHNGTTYELKDDTARESIENLATVATSGSYDDLSDKPEIPAAQVNADWEADSGVAEILNKPNLATVATSGSYNDLSDQPDLFSGDYNDLSNKPELFSGDYNDLNNKPDLFSGDYNDLSNKPEIPAAQVNADWNANSGVAQILNKPTLFSGDYDDLSNKPTIPADTSDLTNGAGFITESALNGYATESYVDTGLGNKQDTLSQTQLAAVNSGITSNDVTQIGTNQTDIDAIEEKIPNQASAQNQLADKSFVNSSIATNTADFIGTFNSMEDLNGYSGTVTNNDYAFVISTDNDGNTVYNRYKYNGSSWAFEYALNNSSFTASQWAAINSGATSTNIGQISTNTASITSLQNQAGNSILTTTAQTLSAAINELDSEMPAAQVNSDWNANSGVAQILNKPSLATVATSGSYADLTNKPTIPTTTDNVTQASAAALTSGGAYTALSAKQDVIDSSNKLSASYVSGLATVATTGAYSDLSGTPTIPEAVVTDDSTITENAQNKIQTVSVVNANTASSVTTPLKLWEGTANQYNQAEATQWYNWSGTDAPYNTSSAVPAVGASGYGSSATWSTYANRIKNCDSLYVGFLQFEVASKERLIYTSNGLSWNETASISGPTPEGIAFGNGVYVISGYGGIKYTTDFETFTNAVSGVNFGGCDFGNGKFVAWNRSINNVSTSTYGTSWEDNTVALPATLNNETDVFHVGDFFVLNERPNGTPSKTFYVASDSDTTTWTAQTTPDNNNLLGIVHGNNKYVMLTSGKNVYVSTDNMVTWTLATTLTGTSAVGIAFGDNKFVVAMSNRAYMSADTTTWTDFISSSYPDSLNGCKDVCFGNKFVFLFDSSVLVSLGESQSTTVYSYTLSDTPEVNDAVYLEPNTATTLYVTAKGTGSFTASDGVTYTYNSGGNTTTYRSVGDLHPTWLCNIENVGLKIGTTFIADYSAPAIGDIDTALTAIIAQGS